VATNRPYLSLIQSSVKSDGVYFEEISPNYLYRSILGNKSFIMHDIEVGLNNSAAAKIAMSKSGTFETLRHFQIPAIEHVFLMNNNSRFSKSDSFELAKTLFYQWGKKVVLKQDNGSQGHNVYKITTMEELVTCLQTLFSLNVDGAISPFNEATYEYRIVTLENEPKLFLAKERTTSWKHNLIGGALSKDVPEDKIPLLTAIASNASLALELDFCTVDILETSNGLFVLEINEQVMLDEFCKNDKERQEKVAQLYREAIIKRFEKIST
jgi:glutathione synthase/RimK-type ligase-like ATP-grasp enzyme